MISTSSHAHANEWDIIHLIWHHRSRIVACDQRTRIPNLHLARHLSLGGSMVRASYQSSEGCGLAAPHGTNSTIVDISSMISPRSYTQLHVTSHCMCMFTSICICIRMCIRICMCTPIYIYIYLYVIFKNQLLLNLYVSGTYPFISFFKKWQG